MSPRKPAAGREVVLDLYCRISKDYDGTLRAVEDQEEQGRAWVEAHAYLGYVLGVVYRDHALSGWNPKVERPEWNELMGRLESGQAGGVWVRDLDRFTRKLSEAERLLQAAESGAIVVAGHSAYDLTTARGRRQFREDAVDAAYESDRISERTSRGKASKARRGKSNAAWRGFARNGYGPKPEGWEPGDPRELVDPDLLAREQAAVREAADLLLSGTGTLLGIAEDWNAAGLLTVTGKRWDGGLVRQLLSAPSLAGLIEHKGEIVGQLDGEHALDRATWDRLQTHFASRRRGRPAAAYLLSGIARCGRCGSRLYGRPRTGSVYKDGSPRREYWCQPRPKEGVGCGRVHIDQRFADAAVREVALEVLGDPRHADRLARIAAKVKEARHTILEELHRLEEDGKGIASKVASRGLAWVEAAMEPIDARTAELRAQLAALEEPDTTATVDAERAWENASLTEQRAMVRRAFPRGITIKPASTRGTAARTADRFDFSGGSDRGSDQYVA
jgi:DNA invertase Pin-like site-specific DNA recombinase